MFGAFVRISDAGLGCPDWPGCYGKVTPFGAMPDIRAEALERPHGPVTVFKAWVEMLHRYAASALGLLIIGLAWLAWRERREAGSAAEPRRASSAYPAGASAGRLRRAGVVHLVLGDPAGHVRHVDRHPAPATGIRDGAPAGRNHPVRAPAHAAQPDQPRTRRSPAKRRDTGPGAWLALALLFVQIALGGWVSSNYATLACQDFPMCQGSWWPDMDIAAGFEIWRPLGRTADGAGLPFPALTAIHYAHRLMAYVVLARNRPSGLARAAGRRARAGRQVAAGGIAGAIDYGAHQYLPRLAHGCRGASYRRRDGPGLGAPDA